MHGGLHDPAAPPFTVHGDVVKRSTVPRMTGRASLCVWWQKWVNHQGCDDWALSICQSTKSWHLLSRFMINGSWILMADCKSQNINYSSARIHRLGLTITGPAAYVVSAPCLIKSQHGCESKWLQYNQLFLLPAVLTILPMLWEYCWPYQPRHVFAAIDQPGSLVNDGSWWLSHWKWKQSHSKIVKYIGYWNMWVQINLHVCKCMSANTPICTIPDVIAHHTIVCTNVYLQCRQIWPTVLFVCIFVSCPPWVSSCVSRWL